jgi:hypothetical protein
MRHLATSCGMPSIAFLRAAILEEKDTKTSARAPCPKCAVRVSILLLLLLPQRTS